jgi:hypothetical protein
VEDNMPFVVDRYLLSEIPISRPAHVPNRLPLPTGPIGNVLVLVPAPVPSPLRDQGVARAE